jgi:ATP sulfurylase
MLDKHYPEGKVLLSAFQNYSRYAGPREAIFTALCRKNFGCSHFIVGRDHTGVGNYYGPNDAHDLFEHLGDIGITPIFFNRVYFCEKCNQYVEECEHGDMDGISISGTECREMLSSNISPPDWFMRKDISNLILSEIKRGEKVFVK